MDNDFAINKNVGPPCVVMGHAPNWVRVDVCFERVEVRPGYGKGLFYIVIKNGEMRQLKA